MLFQGHGALCTRLLHKICSCSSVTYCLLTLKCVASCKVKTLGKDQDSHGVVTMALECRCLNEIAPKGYDGWHNPFSRKQKVCEFV